MLHRLLSLQGEALARAEKTKDGDLVVEVAFSSEEPYQRWWGIEILDHSETSIRLQRLNNGAPLLYNHNWNDLRGTHVPRSVRIDNDRILRGKVQVTSVTQAGRDTIGLVQSGVLSKASIGYQIHHVIEQTTQKGVNAERRLDGRLFEQILTRQHSLGGGGDLAAFRRSLDDQFGAFERDPDEPTVYRVVDWEPLENSLVTIPADDTVGVGRGSEEVTARVPRAEVQPADSAIHRKETSMSTEAQLAAEAEAAKKKEQEEKAAAAEALSRQRSMSAVDMEKGRKRAIENLCKANKLDDKYRDHWIGMGLSIEDVSDELLKLLEERGRLNPQSPARLGLSEPEAKRFSLARAIYATAEKDWKHAAFEAECSREIAKNLNRMNEPNKFFVPFEVLQRPAAQRERRDLTSGTGSAGGFLVSTDNIGFIEMLRNRSVAFRMGVRRLSGLMGNVTVPRQSAAATAFWLSTEATAITESQQTFVQMALTPKNVGAYTEISRQLLLQSSPAAEGIVTDDLAQVVALAVDLAVLEGSGASGQPTGISNTAGIGSVTGTSIAYAGVLEFQTDVAGSNVMPQRGGYVTTPAVASLLMQRVKFTSTASPLWEGNIWDGSMAGFPAMSSNQPSAATMTFGDWQEAVVGEWGVLEVEVNPYANFPAGIIGVRAMYSMDVGIRRPFAFSRATSIT